MNEVIPLTQEHLDEIGAPDVGFFLTGTAYTLICDGKIIAVTGMLVLWSGVGTLWAIVMPEARKHKFFFHRTMSILLQIHSKGLHRIQATVISTDKRSRKWIEHLGFQPEGFHRMYDPDKNDHIGYAKLIWHG